MNACTCIPFGSLNCTLCTFFLYMLSNMCMFANQISKKMLTHFAFFFFLHILHNTDVCILRRIIALAPPVPPPLSSTLHLPPHQPIFKLPLPPVPVGFRPHLRRLTPSAAKSPGHSAVWHSLAPPTVTPNRARTPGRRARRLLPRRVHPSVRPDTSREPSGPERDAGCAVNGGQWDMD